MEMRRNLSHDHILPLSKASPTHFSYSFSLFFHHHHNHPPYIHNFISLSSPLSPSLSFSMAQNHSLSLLVAAMDGLWFNQVILFSNPMSLLSPTTLRIAPQTTSSDSLLYCLSDLSAPPPSEEETSAHSSASPLPQVIKSHFCLQT